MTSKLLMRDNRPVHFSWARSIVESATIKGLAPRLCFWTRRLRGKRLRRSDDDRCTPLTGPRLTTGEAITYPVCKYRLDTILKGTHVYFNSRIRLRSS